MMQEMHEPPEGVRPTRSRRRPPRKRTAPIQVPGTWSQEDVEALLAAHQEAIAEQVAEGIAALQQTAVQILSQLKRPDGVNPEDTARGLLAHVDERYQELTLRMERLEGALRRLVQTLKGAMSRRTEPGGQAVSGLARRIDSLSASVREAASRQEKGLEDFTKQTGEGLAQVAARAGEGLVQATRRQEVFLDERLDDMRQAIESLRDAEANGEPSTGEAATGEAATGEVPSGHTASGSGGPETPTGATLKERLDEAGKRLARMSGELSTSDRSATPSGEDEGRPPDPSS
jgi:hypothetical protein